MTSDPLSETPKRRSSVVSLLTILVVLAIGAVFFLADKRDELIAICGQKSVDPQAELSACETLVKWGGLDPANRSMAYRNMMRVYMDQGDRAAALKEADLAIKADPGSQVPWQWKALILARAEDYPAALVAINEALVIAPEDEYSLETKAKILWRMNQ